MAEGTVSAKHRDPLISPFFTIEINGTLAGKVQAYFKEVSGLGSENAIVSYRVDRGRMSYVQKQPGLVKYQDITLKRGVTEDLGFWDWRQQIIDGKVNAARASGSVVLYNQEGTEVARWNFVDAWPSKISGPGLNSGGDEIAVEEVTLVCEKLERIS